MQGKRFGSLVCIGVTTLDGFGGTIWRCRCDCGNELDVSEAMLISGVVRSCGCKKTRAVNMKGRKFGMLTVLEPVPMRAQDGSVCWLCRCECGKYITQSANKLRTGRSISCGCQAGVAAREAKTFIDGTCVEIMLSEALPKNNTSGVKGVAKKGNGWQAYINYGKKRRYLGTFATIEEAALVRREAEEKIKERLMMLMDERAAEK